MYKKILNNFGLDKVFLIGCFLYLVSAINNPVTEINFSSIKSIIIFFRGLAPYILFPLLIFYMAMFKKEIKFEFIYLLSFLYFFGQLIGYVINPLGYDYHVNQQNQFYWLLISLTNFLFFYIIRGDKNLNILFLKIFITIITIISIKFLYDVYVEFFLEILNSAKTRNYFYNIESMSPNRLFLDQPVPRSSGLSRMILLMFLFIYTQLIFVKNHKYINFIYFLCALFLVFSLYNLQNSITIFYILILFGFTIFFKISDFSFKKKLFTQY